MSTASPEVLRRIPHRPPFLFVDEIVSESPEGLVARRTLRPTYPRPIQGSPLGDAPMGAIGSALSFRRTCGEWRRKRQQPEGIANV